MTWGCATHRRLPDGRLHLQHGPIDLIIEAFATQAAAIEAAYAHAVACFENVLAKLVQELPLLRTALTATAPPLHGCVAQRMLAACWPYRNVFITPMAAVAGSVADEILCCMINGRDIDRAYVNNGGDIALHLAPGERFRVGMANIENAVLAGGFEITAAMPVRGVATSGWRGRSLSLGIADAVTVTAHNAACADAAATMIANAVNAQHHGIYRLPARQVRDDSDLLDLPVTVAVDPLPREIVIQALENGLARARDMQQCGLIHAATLRLQGHEQALEPVATSELNLEHRRAMPTLAIEEENTT